ncbi:MAG: DUF3641 domain-containing protein [Pseudomonas sp.]|nr:DUF3641 domain-containing protein [Pseudomonas sp.]MDP2245698.1 DUF3641 domain-containing protein [Pseudomonas sp.]
MAGQSSYRPENLDSVMCKSLVSVDWQGYLYDRAFISRHLGKQ